ncbi:MAG: hypothetical protein ACRD5H_14910, partial [Nitrososphaerales archaeon]
PAHLSAFDLQLYSGVSSMEVSHSLWRRLINDTREWNDVIHLLYNLNLIQIQESLNAVSVLYWKKSMMYIVPDLSYGWNHRQEIMEGIRNGKYADTGQTHKYWSDPTFAGPVPSVVAATEHELSYLREFIEQCFHSPEHKSMR